MHVELEDYLLPSDARKGGRAASRAAQSDSSGPMPSLLLTAPPCLVAALLYNRRSLNSAQVASTLRASFNTHIPDTQMTCIVNLNRTACSDFPMRRSVAENNQAVVGHCRAINVRLAESEVVARNLSGKAIGMDVIYDNSPL